VRLDTDAADEDAFNRWYDEEHIPERLACPGFLGARRYKSVEGGPAYLTIYDLEGTEALESPEYKALSTNRSERTKEMVASMRSLTRTVFLEIQASTRV
jgi:hypothetical protein